MTSQGIRRALAALFFFLAAAHAQVPPAEALQAQLKTAPHIRALLIAKDGRQVFEYYRADTAPGTLLNVASVTKSVTSLLVGIAADRGLLRLDEPLAAFFPEYAQGADAAKLEGITLRHMLSMSSGFHRRGLDWDTDYGDFNARFYAPGLLKLALGRPVVNVPGSQFYYSNIDSHLVMIALSRRVKVPVREFARDALFRPLGIGAFDWSSNSEGFLDGAAGLRISAPDMLRIGQMMAGGGMWQGRQVVPGAFVQEATSRHAGTDIPVRGSPNLWGYGYLWWLSSTPVDDRPAFYAAGYGGQFIYVVPSLDAVIVSVTEQASREIAARTAALLRDFALPVAR